MNSVRRWSALLPILFGLIVANTAAAEDISSTPIMPTMSVSTVMQKDVHEWLHVYGRVGFDDAAVQNINLAYSGQVIRLPLLAGELVKKGQVLAEIAVDPAVASAYQQALAAVSFAESELARTKKMLAGQLATRFQLAAARKRLTDARSQLRQLRQKGFGKSIHVIRAAFDAVVASISVQTGQRMTAGTTLMRLGHPDRLNVILGVEPEDIRQIKAGNTVLLHTASAPTTIVHASVDRVLHAVNLQTRLVDVLVRLVGEQAKPFLPGMTVSAELASRNLTHALVIPRSALVQQDGRLVLMRIDKEIAYSVPVDVILEQGEDAVIMGDIAKGQVIVTEGVAELHDGDAVRVKSTE
ncbi:efflux RND transporter periplasmic adaptor subunit [Mariprofundus ferrooxydans]|nr:efflux RND transporter periplasmic adaptor subunit [Mariprofundus ferrooxydans]